MRASGYLLPTLVFLALPVAAVTQTGSPALPATAPTTLPGQSVTPPIAATASTGVRAGSRTAQVQCAGGQLEVHAQNSSLSQILHAISRCTGMRISGQVPETRVFGDYGPAAPATVLATLLDGTGSNMLLQETAADQPAQLILSPRMGAPTPPAMAGNAGEDADDEQQPQPTGATTPQNPYRQAGQRGIANVPQPNGAPSNGAQPGAAQGMSGEVPLPYPGSTSVNGPLPIPQPTNDVNGSPNNTSPTASTYPVTNSVPLDSVRTPSTTPATDGIVDAPNPPAAGSDTAAALNGAPKGTPGTTNINPGNTSQTSTPGGTNTTVPVTNSGSSTDQPAQITPEQVFQQLQQRMQQQQQQQQQENTPQ